MSKYEAKKVTEGSVELDCLVCAETGAEIRVAPKNGLNMTSWIVGGQDLLWKPEGFFSKKPGETLGWGGSPLLFPAVGRTHDLTANPPVTGQYKVNKNGPVFQMPIHGLGGLLSWELEKSGMPEVEKGEEMPDMGILQYRCVIPDAVKKANYPFDIDFRVSYGLSKEEVFVAFEALSVNGQNAHFAFGIHPFLAVSSRKGLVLTVPSKHVCELAPGLGIPAKPGTAQRSDDYSSGRELDLSKGIDRVFMAVGQGETVLADKGAGRKFVLKSDAVFDHCVVYTDEKGPFLCVEPWTSGLGGFCYMSDRTKFGFCGMPRVNGEETAAGSVSLSVAKL